jgi:hypothetical protein
MAKIAKYLFFFLLFSCQEKTKDDIQDFGEIVPKSSKTVVKDTLKISQIDSVKIKYYEKIDYIAIDSVKEISNSLLPDRFNPIKKVKETIYYKTDSLQFCEWKYKDTTSLKQALYNLMDCFETPCKPIKMYESKNVSKSSFTILCYQKSMIFLKSSSEINLKNWLVFLDDQKGYNSFELIISQPKNGKTKWFSYSNTNLIPSVKK